MYVHDKHLKKSSTPLHSFWTLNTCQAVSHEITLVCVSVCLSVRLSLRLSFTKFSQDWIIIFFGIVHDNI